MVKIQITPIKFHVLETFVDAEKFHHFITITFWLLLKFTWSLSSISSPAKMFDLFGFLDVAKYCAIWENTIITCTNDGCSFSHKNTITHTKLSISAVLLSRKNICCTLIPLLIQPCYFLSPHIHHFNVIFILKIPKWCTCIIRNLWEWLKVAHHFES